MQNLTELIASFFDKAFWQQFVTMVAGLVVGIPVALWINRLQVRAEKHKERELESERRRTLLEALVDRISFNQAFIRDAETKFEKIVILENVDLGILDATATLKYELLDDFELCKKLDDLRFHLTQVHCKLDLLLRMYFDGSIHCGQVTIGDKSVPMYIHLRGELLAPLRNHFATVLGICDDVLPVLKKGAAANVQGG